MRITSGEFRGRTVDAPAGADVRPTQDRVREALFSMLGECVRGAAFLDLFAGSGAVGLEAVSRGASRAAFVESAARPFACLSANIARFGAAPRCETFRADVLAWLAAPARTPFDVAFADPPYALCEQGVYQQLLQLLADGGHVPQGGLFVAEMTSRRSCDESPAWELLRDRVYGQSRLAVYRRK
jgi:16S rRNA (guanine966-N2)-methyltransferase